MRLDVPTLVACHVATSWTLAAVVVALLGRHLPLGGALYLFALVLHGLVAELALLSGNAASWPGDIASNVLLSVAFSLSYLGLARLAGAKPFWLAVVAPPLLVLAAWTCPRPSYGEPTALSNIIFSLQHLAAIGALMARLKEQADRPTLLLATTEAGVALLLAMQGADQGVRAWLGQPAGPQWSPVTLMAAQVLMAIHIVAVLLVVQIRALDRAEEKVAHDALTGVASRGCLFALGPQLLERAHAVQRSCSLLMVDLDLFKLVNDRFGHQVGDEVLVAVAHAMRQSLRPSDIIGRYGGEEFCVVLYGAVAVQAVEVAERIRENVRSLRPIACAPDQRVTVSIGIAEASPLGLAGFDDLLRRADAAMYRVKLAGRDGVAVDGISAVARGAAGKVELAGDQGDYGASMRPGAP